MPNRLFPTPLLWALLASIAAPAAANTIPPPQTEGRAADFAGKEASAQARQVADWIVVHGDNQTMPFIIVDKLGAKVFVFDAAGRLIDAAPVLLGLAQGDVAPVDIGSRKLSAILPGERITPAGRFITAIGRNLAKKEILWIDYASALSLHPVVTGNVAERRLQRLQSPSIEDNRVSYGCINVPADFFAAVISKAFAGTAGITYILPEVRSIHQVFPINAPVSQIHAER